MSDACYLLAKRVFCARKLDFLAGAFGPLLMNTQSLDLNFTVVCEIAEVDGE